jgi:adenylate cyclase
MSDVKISEEQIKEAWLSYLTQGEMPAYMQAPWFERKVFRPLIKNLPRSPRCDICYIPFHGVGGNLSRIFWKAEPSKLNPHICNLCENFAQKYHGGVEIEISMMFVDVRGSVTLAENTPLNDYRNLINRFYRAVTEEFYRSYGFVEKLIGDEVAGFFVPGFAGKNHAKVAIETGQRILKTMGYGSLSGSWLPIGIGINTGIAYVGSVTPQGGGADIAMLGDSVNTTARLTSLAGAGEIIISDSSLQASKLSTDGMELRNLKLKGKSEEVPAWVLKVKK